MEKLDRALTYFLFFSLFVGLFMVIILSLGDEKSVYVSIGLLMLCGLICLTFIIRALSNKPRKIGEAIILVVMLGAGTVAASLIVEMNTELNQHFKEEDPNLRDKGQLVWSKMHQVPKHKKMMVKEVEGIKFFYTEKSEPKIEEVVSIINNNRKLWDSLLGKEREQLAIEFKDNPYINEGAGSFSDARGYFNALNKTISVESTDKELEYVVKHEYTHYRVHQYITKHRSYDEHIPQWFNEGFADVIATYDGEDYMSIEKMPEVKNLHSMDTNKDFHKLREDGFETYQQSFIAVRTLVNLYGFEKVVLLFQAETPEDFYADLEKLTGKTLDEFELTLLK